MRDIKFRGKRVDNGEWVYGFYAYKEESNKTFIMVETINQYYPSYFTECKVDPNTVGQYTGLKDKNGKEIYDNDVINFTHTKYVAPADKNQILPDVERYSRNYIVEYINTFITYGLRARNKSINFKLKQSTISMHDAEVIGNIHDNPELLGGESHA